MEVKLRTSLLAAKFSEKIIFLIQFGEIMLWSWLNFGRNHAILSWTACCLKNASKFRLELPWQNKPSMPLFSWSAKTGCNIAWLAHLKQPNQRTFLLTIFKVIEDKHCFCTKWTFFLLPELTWSRSYFSFFRFLNGVFLGWIKVVEKRLPLEFSNLRKLHEKLIFWQKVPFCRPWRYGCASTPNMAKWL